MTKKPIIIYGPTASGKSEVAIKIAKETNGYIINADASQVYKEAPILANIPSKEEKQEVEHYLFSIISLSEDFSVAKWLTLVKELLDKNENKQAIIVGGTGFYISALINGISKIPSCEKSKNEALKFYELLGYEKFLEHVKSFDAELAEKHTDPQRLIRATEVFFRSGKNLSTWQKEPLEKIIDREFTTVYVSPSRESVYEKINSRFDSMIENNALLEVKNIMQQGIKSTLFKKVIGISELSNYLNGNIELQEAVEQAKKASRNYAKRQYTWFNNQLEHTINISSTNEVETKKIKQLL